MLYICKRKKGRKKNCGLSNSLWVWCFLLAVITQCTEVTLFEHLYLTVLLYTLIVFQYNQHPQCNPVIIEDMPHMAQFVFDFYKDKVTNLVRAYGVSKTVITIFHQWLRITEIS